MPLVLPLLLILSATLYRIVAAWYPDLVNFSPLMALTFCGAVYFRNKWLWLVPFVALTLSDLYLDHYYKSAFGETWTVESMVMRTICFVAALALGVMVARRKSWLTLAAGTLGGSLFFYLATNSHAWYVDPHYAKTLAGWFQAMTVGRPEFPPTIYFFRNTIVSDVLFTAIFAFVMETAAARRGEGNLLSARAGQKA